MLSFAPAAQAQRPVSEPLGLKSLSVPLDHGNPGGAKLRLTYAHFPAPERPRGTIVFLAGGPGQSAISDARDIADGVLGELRRRYDIVVVDQRGTGRSAPLRCPSLRTLGDETTLADMARAIVPCAERLGGARSFFSTYETVLDLDDLRAALGVDQIIPLGVSYGGQVAGEYARRFPERVQALILDSPSPIEGLDTLGRLAQVALPRVLEEICFTRGCERILGDTRVMLARAVEVIGARGLSGITRGALYDLLRASDLDPLIRAELPSALQAATQRDADPLLRLMAYAGVGDDGGSSGINQARYLATTCMEGQLPWAPESDPSGRVTTLLEQLEATEDEYEPFPFGTVLTRIPASACVAWPSTPKPPPPPAISPAPDVPVLVLAGREDLRTPLEDQRRTAAQFPRGQVLAVPGVGHSVLGTDLSGCASRGVRLFLAGRRPAPCADRRLLDVALPAFQSLREVPRPRGRTVSARIGRTAVAVDLTLRDAERWAVGAALSDVRSVPGLRGGRLINREESVVLRRYEVVPGVRVSGMLSEGPDRLRITGRGATGTLVIRNGVVRGVLDGKTIVYQPLAPRAQARAAIAGA